MNSLSFMYSQLTRIESMYITLPNIVTIIDLPKLHTISFINAYCVLQGKCQSNDKVINGHSGYDNKLIMRSMYFLLEFNSYQTTKF